MKTPALVLAFSLAAGALLAEAPAPARLPARDGARDFDFFVGEWKTHHRRLRNPLTGSTTWVEFDGTVSSRMLWGNRVSEDEGVINDPAGRLEGMTVRFYNTKTQEWSIYWASSTFGGALVLPPVVGRFDRKDGTGEFYDQETFKDRTILVRYRWFDIKPDSCRWEQAFSADGGQTWETNWTMLHERVK